MKKGICFSDTYVRHIAVFTSFIDSTFTTRFIAVLTVFNFRYFRGWFGVVVTELGHINKV